jgi:hypothetical protein
VTFKWRFEVGEGWWPYEESLWKAFEANSIAVEGRSLRHQHAWHFFFFDGSGIWIQDLQSRCSTAWVTLPVHFAPELFAWTGQTLILLFSAFQVAKITGMSHWLSASLACLRQRGHMIGDWSGVRWWRWVSRGFWRWEPVRLLGILAKALAFAPTKLEIH